MFDFEKVKEYLSEKGIPFEEITFPDEVISARARDNSLTKNYNPSNAIKTLVVETKEGFVGIILKGLDRLDSKKAKEILGRWSIVDTDTLENKLGFKVGGINPFCLNIPLFIDKKIKNLQILSMGAGSQSKGMNIESKWLFELENAQIKDISL